MSPLPGLVLAAAVLAFQEPAPAPRPAESQEPATSAQPPQKGKGKGKGQRKDGDPGAPRSKPSSPVDSLRLRSIGPAMTSGRVVGIAVHPNDRATYYVAVASGGVWKTTNNGTTWSPVFDSEGSFSIGYVTLDPKNPDTVWVGTGENNSQRSVAYGDGVYKSTNGGQSWTNVGLKASEHVGKIVIDPRNSDTVYVAAQGPLWGPGGDRGLYKTTDGGKTWNRVLNIDENTGVTDVILDPRNPDILVAASYQRRRHVWTLVNGGPGSAIHRSTDGGKTWSKVGGLPGVDLGRIGLAIAPSDPDIVYAVVEAADKQGGLFRSSDGGKSFSKVNPFDSQGQYYAHVVVDPANKDRLYVMNVLIQVSNDGGRTLSSLGERSKHVDNHTIWVDPKDPKYYLVGCDGGLYESLDRGANWHFKSNLPVTQFYDVAVDQNPASGPFYHVYGGTQDNYTLGLPVRTRSSHGITNGDVFVVQGGDGFHCKVDPTDPNIVYGEYQYAGLCRYDRRTGNRVEIQPQARPGEPPLRWNWDSPLLISPHNQKRLYFAANKLFKSDDRGDNWTAVSPDLTRQLDRDLLPVFGKIQPPDAVSKHVSTSFYGNIVALAESLKTEGLLYAGTDDGLIQVTEDGGKTWRKVDKFPGVPDRTYVSKLVASQHDAGTVFASFDNHKNADFKPYLLKSTDAGKTWTSIAGDLPERGTVYCLAEDHVRADLLFCGTEFGLFVTLDGGKKWQRLNNGLPTIQVKDLAIQKANDDLVVATFGRGFYVIDDYSPIRQVDSELLKKDGHLFPVRDTMLYVPSAQFGGGRKAFLGESFYTAENPPYGVAFTFHQKAMPKTLKEKRKEAEQAAKKADKDKEPPYPSKEQLRAEAEEEPAVAMLTIADRSGAVVRVLSCPTSEGIHRVTWDFREAGSFADEFAGGGPRVTPGTYRATLGRRVAGAYTSIAGPVEFKVLPDPLSGLKDADYAEIAAFNKKVRLLRRTVSQTLTASGELMSRLEKTKAATDQATPPGDPARKKVRDLIAAVKASERVLQGDSFLASRNENTPESLFARTQNAATANDAALARPTGTQKQSYEDAGKQLREELAKLRQIQDKDLPELEKKLDALGAPTAPGKLPVWDGR